MRSLLSSTPIFFRASLAALLAILLLAGLTVQQVQAQKPQKLSTMMAKKDLAGICAAVEKDPSLLTKDDSRTKQSPLFDAIQSGQGEIVDLLLELGAPTNTLNRQKQTPLQFALTLRRPKIVESVLAKTENINQADGRQKASSLMYVIMYRSPDVRLIDLMILKGADINHKNSNKQTALHIACYYNNIEAAKKLLSAGADLSHQDNNSNTPLLAACMISPELTAEMLSREADPLATNRQNQTALHLVCQASHAHSAWDSEVGAKTFQTLLSKFDNVDLVDQQKLTPLALAVFAQNPKFVKALIDRGADPNVEIDGQRFGNGDRSLVSAAATLGDAGTIQALVDGGARVNVVNQLGQTPLHSIAQVGGNAFGRHDEKATKRFSDAVATLLAAKADPNAKNKEGQTPLALAASRDFYAAVELLVDRTEELDIKLAQGSLLHWAAQNGLIKTAKRLLSKETTAQLDVNESNSAGRTPLLVAAANGNPEMVELLIANGAILDHPDNDGATALLIAATAGEATVAEALLQAGADTTKLDSSGHSALHLAAWSGDPKVIKLLLERMKVAQSITTSGYTPLHAAAWNGHELAVVALLQGGADPNVADSDGWTPLHKAAYRGHVKAVKALVDSGADKSLKNGVEMTALALAKSNGKADKIELLLK